MSSLSTIRDSFTAAVTEFEAGRWVAGGRKFTEGLNGMLDVAADFGFQAGPETEEAGKDCKRLLERAKAVVTAPQAGEVGAIGDGKIRKALENLIAVAIQILPLIAPFL